jgi:(p)ppGpp synthase/HD superfamily hydrolase
MSKLVAKAKNLALIWHSGQYRHDGKTPYWKHPMAVAGKLRKQGANEYVVAIAWLHDILEDTNYMAAQLREDFPDPVADAVIALTKYGADYDHYLRGVKANEFARRVKIADMLHNLSDSPTEKQILKYAKGLAFLMS